MGWLIANVIATPLVQFWADRRSAIQALRTHGSVGWLSSEERVKQAQAAINEAAARITYYAEAGPGIVRLYSWIRGYDLGLAGRALNGVHAKIGASSAAESNLLQCDAVRVCLGATKTMSPARRASIRDMLDDADRIESKGD